MLFWQVKSIRLNSSLTAEHAKSSVGAASPITRLKQIHGEEFTTWASLAGGLWWAAGLRRTIWQVFPGRNRELGNWMC